MWPVAGAVVLDAGCGHVTPVVMGGGASRLGRAGWLIVPPREQVADSGTDGSRAGSARPLTVEARPIASAIPHLTLTPPRQRRVMGGLRRARA